MLSFYNKQDNIENQDQYQYLYESSGVNGKMRCGVRQEHSPLPLTHYSGVNPIRSSRRNDRNYHK